MQSSLYTIDPFNIMGASKKMQSSYDTQQELHTIDLLNIMSASKKMQTSHAKSIMKLSARTLHHWST